MPDPRQKRVELILQQLDELPTLPAVAVRVLEVTGRDDSSIGEVVKLLESDPALTTRILALVRRADLGARGDVSSVDRAVALLGFEAVRCSVLALSVFQTLNGTAGGPGTYFDRDAFWKHSVAVACCAELLVEQLPDGRDDSVTPSSAFVAGLLHDIGKVALDAVLPKSFNRVVEGTDLLRGNIADLERNIIGLDHQTVGKRLAERWQLPGFIREVAWLHGQLADALPVTTKHNRLINLVSLADLIVRRQHLGYSGNYTFAGKTGWMESLSLTTAQVDDVVRRLVGHIEPRATALGLGRADADDLYRTALSQANKELGRIGDQLTTRNRRLQVRSKFFDALGGFQGDLKPDATPQQVLAAIGRTVVGVIGVKAVAAFSMPPAATFAEATFAEATFAEAVLVDEAGDVFETTLIDCPARPAGAGSGDGPVLAAGDDLDWFLSAVSPRLSESSRFWSCFSADDQCVGGVVWGAAAGESQRLGGQAQELTALSHGFSLALRNAQIRDESRALSEQLADANRRLVSAQAELLRSRTMLAVGEMAAGAAHEINNPLAVISGRSQLLAAQLTDPKLKHAATVIHEHAGRVSEIISELMEFARPTPPTLDTVDVADLIGRAVHDAKCATEPADRRIETTVTDVPAVRVDETQVAAAIAELVGNAIQATDARTGRIEVHAAFDSATGRVIVTVTDDGHGMDEPTQRRAFDPFFSAKPAGRRRGMGLPQALRWVEASGGSIRLESRADHGTRAVVLLPAEAAAVAEVEEPIRRIESA